MKLKRLIIVVCILLLSVGVVFAAGNKFGSHVTGFKTFRDGVKILPQPDKTLEIPTLDQDGQKGIDIKVSADTDGDEVYGRYTEVGLGTGALTTADRKAYGSYNKVISAVDMDAGWLYSPLAYGVYNLLDASTNLAQWAQSTGIANEMLDYSGDNQNICGLANTFRVGGSWSSATAYSSFMYLKHDDGIGQFGWGSYQFLDSLGPSDEFYGMFIGDWDTGALITGGTAYGSYIDLDDPDYDAAWSHYVVDGSAPSYFGSNTEVNGILKITPAASRTCNAAAEGGFMYDSDDNHFYGCNGTAWVQLD